MTDIMRGVTRSPGEPPLAFSQWGAGPDVVLIHGALSTHDDMVLAFYDHLRPNLRVTAFDRPGHGHSGSVGPTGSPWRQAEALHAASAELGLVRPVLVGHSHGGAVAMAYALAFPNDVAAVVALAPIVLPEARLEHLIFGPRTVPVAGDLLNGLASAALDPLLLPALWRAMFFPQELPRKFIEGFPFALAGSAAQLKAEGEDAAFLNIGLARSVLNYGRCRVPVRVFGGDRDRVVNNSLHGRALAALVPDGAFTRLEGLGHMLHHFAQPRIVEFVLALGP